MTATSIDHGSISTPDRERSVRFDMRPLPNPQSGENLRATLCLRAPAGSRT